MNKQTIIKILFFLALVCIFLLILISQRQSIKQITLAELNNLTAKSEGKEILTQGIISQINYNQKYQTIYLKNCTIPFVALTNNLLDLKENQLVTISGKLEIYQNKPQILIDKIKEK